MRRYKKIMDLPTNFHLTQDEIAGSSHLSTIGENTSLWESREGGETTFTLCRFETISKMTGSRVSLFRHYPLTDACVLRIKEWMLENLIGG